MKIEAAPSAWCNLRRKRRQQNKNPSNSTPENVHDSADKIELTIEIYKHSGTCKLCLIPSDPTTRDKVNNLAMYLRGKV
uniref:Uncharacterized protein n=1 Tax=Ciona savignyi TaxID=51511 RepID=H2ZD19_CIOSA